MDTIKDPAFIVASVALLLIVGFAVFFYYKVVGLSTDVKNLNDAIQVLQKKPGELMGLVNQLAMAIKEINEKAIPQVTSLRSENEALRQRLEYLEEFLEKNYEFEIIDPSNKKARRRALSRQVRSSAVTPQKEQQQTVTIEEKPEVPKPMVRKQKVPTPPSSDEDSDDDTRKPKVVSSDSDDDLAQEMAALRQKKQGHRVEKSSTVDDFF